MPKGVAKGRSKGKTPARRKLQLDSSTTTSDRGQSSRPVASASQSRPPVDLASPEKPSGKIPPPPLLYKDGDTFSSVLEKYSGWKGNRLTPRKRELLYYIMVYHDDGDDDGEKGDDEKDVSQRMGIEGASEIIKESRVPKSVRKDAQVVGDDSEGVGEGRAVGKQVHMTTKERFGARKAASLSEVESVVVGGDESEGVGDGRLRKLVSVGGTEVHAVLSEGEEVSVGGEEGRVGRSPSEADTPSRKSYLSSSDSGESGDDDDSDFQLSDRDERNDYEGYEERDSESDFLSELEEEEEEEEDEVRGRRYIRARSQRSGRRLRGGQRGRRRRMGIGKASSSRSRSPIDGGAGGRR